jgi:hypothetical protein
MVPGKVAFFVNPKEVERRQEARPVPFRQAIPVLDCSPSFIAH